MAAKYIYELKQWPDFHWDQDRIAEKLAAVRHRQGRLIGRMEGLGFNLRAEAVLQSLTEEVLKTSEIEGEKLDRSQVRSSIARRLGLDIGGLTRADRSVEGIVEMMLDATQKFDSALTVDRLFGWHASLFPTGRSGMNKIRVGKWRDDCSGPMQVISGPIGKSKIHYQAPEASLLNQEMKAFLEWFNSKKRLDAVLKAAIAHLWFVTIHPFEDGNGRIARAVADMALARSEKSPQRFYSMSAQISLERKDYYRILETTQKGNLDITEWLEWFLDYGGKDFKQAILGGVQFMLVLADFELLRETQSGLDLILELGIEKISVLVTSRFEDESVRAVCESKKIKLLPKALASQVPVKVEEGNLMEFVLLDNDPLVHQLWSLSAKRAGVWLHSFFKVEDFFAEVNRFQKDTAISVDFHLEANMNGLQVCERLLLRRLLVH